MQEFIGHQVLSYGTRPGVQGSQNGGVSNERTSDECFFFRCVRVEYYVFLCVCVSAFKSM